MEDPKLISQTVRDHYRCPEDFLTFALSGNLSSERGHFRLGPDAVCYGRSSTGARCQRAEGPLYDVLADVRVENGSVKLPFDLTEVIDNLRLERYAQRRLSGYESAMKSIYYWLRPLTNQFLRKRIQRFHSRNWQKQAFPHWPLDTTVESICEALLLLSLRAKGVERIPFV